MQYTLKLYKNLSENADLIKHLEDENSVIGQNRGVIDILNPEIVLAGIMPNDYNYCYIVELRRYYYIVGHVYDHKGFSILKLKVDVLMTYADDIKASHGLILKQREYNPYFGDYDVESRVNTVQHNFTDPFDHNGEFVLVALRG